MARVKVHQLKVFYEKGVNGGEDKSNLRLFHNDSKTGVRLVDTLHGLSLAWCDCQASSCRLSYLAN
jgi:hypothetical protein